MIEIIFEYKWKLVEGLPAIFNKGLLVNSKDCKRYQ